MKSRPCSTPVPARNLDPFCRIRISPAFTSAPPNRFTPSRLAFESLPLRVLPPAFLCAMLRGLFYLIVCAFCAEIRGEFMKFFLIVKGLEFVVVL